MASQNPHKSEHDEECISENGVGNELMGKKSKESKEIDLCIEQLRREFHRSLDLNHPILNSTSIELNNPYDMGHGMTEAGHLKRGEEEWANLGLSLSLAPPGQQYPPKDDQSSETSSSSQRSCMSLDLNLMDDTESTNAPDRLPSLVLMGCTHCYMYAMVSEIDPKCPKCQSSILIDIFRERPAKRSRTY